MFSQESLLSVMGKLMKTVKETLSFPFPPYLHHQLQEQFGWDPFKKVFAAYHDMEGVPQDNKGKMNTYAETFSKVVNRNLTSFFKAWGWPLEAATEEKLSGLPDWSDHPMAQYA